MSFPDSPGATTGADDLDTLYHKTAEMLAFHIGGTIAEGLAVPQIRSLDGRRDDRLFREDAVDGRIGVLGNVANHASARVMEKAGMRFEGVLRRHTVYPNLHPSRATAGSTPG